METADALAGLSKALNEAQTELAGAEIALLEATARAEDAREAHTRLEAAVAALSGEPPSAATEPVFVPELSDQEPSDNPIHDMSPEEFDAHRKKRQRARQKEEQANNPYAHVKCSGCGSSGTMQDSIITAPSGAPVRMMVCGSCGNQVIS